MILCRLRDFGTGVVLFGVMPRPVFVCDPCSPYHLWARANNRERFGMPLPVAWSVMEDYLCFLSRAYGVRIHSFVLMGNHFHLLATFPNGNLSLAMNYFMRETSRVLGFEADRINHIYGLRVGRSRIPVFHHFMNVYKYVYRNPVQAGLCPRVENYRFSTLSGLLGLTRLNIPVCDDSILFEGDLHQTLSWLNTSPAPENWEAMGKALRRAEFRLAPVRSLRRPHPLNENRL